MEENYIVMRYGIDKGILFMLGIPIYLVIVSIIIFRKRKNGKKIIASNELIKFIFFIYIIELLGVTLFPIEINFRGQAFHSSYTAVNYIPFRSIASDVAQVGHVPFSTAFQIKLLIKNVGGNFILLIPLGFLLPLLIRKINSIKKVLIFDFAVSLSIEMLQFFESYFNIASGRIVDVDDIILNTAGAAVGYLIYTFLNSVIQKYKNKIN